VRDDHEDVRLQGVERALQALQALADVAVALAVAFQRLVLDLWLHWRILAEALEVAPAGQLAARLPVVRLDERGGVPRYHAGHDLRHAVLLRHRAAVARPGISRPRR